MHKTCFKLVIFFFALGFGNLLLADEISDRLHEAEKYFAQKEYNRAIYFYQTVISKDPRNITAYKEIGDCYFQLKEYKKALENYKKVQWLKAGTIDYRLGLTYYCIGEYDTAKDYLNLAFRADSTLLNANFYLAKIYDYQKDYSAALRCYQTEVEVSPLEQNYINLARYYKKVGRYDKTISTIDKTVKKYPKSSEAYLIYAELAEMKNFRDKAIDSYRKAAQLGSGKAQLWMETKGYPWQKEKTFFERLKFWNN